MGEAFPSLEERILSRLHDPSPSKPEHRLVWLIFAVACVVAAAMSARPNALKLSLRKKER